MRCSLDTLYVAFPELQHIIILLDYITFIAFVNRVLFCISINKIALFKSIFLTNFFLFFYKYTAHNNLANANNFFMRGVIKMAKSNNKSVVPEAREALDRFKMEAASEVDVPLPS